MDQYRIVFVWDYNTNKDRIFFPSKSINDSPKEPHGSVKNSTRRLEIVVDFARFYGIRGAADPLGRKRPVWLCI